MLSTARRTRAEARVTDELARLGTLSLAGLRSEWRGLTGRDAPVLGGALLLRLLGRGAVLAQAIEDLKALPRGAKEREVAYQPLVALRFEVQQDANPDQESRAFLMATQDLYEQWERAAAS